MSHNNKRRNTEQSEPPTLADIVRRETNNGETIVRFYLDVIEGKLNDDGFEVYHRLEAAEQVHAIAPGLVSEYIAQLTGLECNHVILRKRTRDTTRSSRGYQGTITPHHIFPVTEEGLCLQPPAQVRYDLGPHGSRLEVADVVPGEPPRLRRARLLVCRADFGVDPVQPLVRGQRVVVPGKS